MTATTAWYSVVRYVPDLVREEQINIGLILVDSAQGYAAVRRASSTAFKRLSLAGSDPSFVHASLDLIQAEIEGLAAQSVIDRRIRDVGAEFRVLMQAHQNNVSLTTPRPIVIEDGALQATHEKLYTRFVERTPGWQEVMGRPTRRQMLGHVKATFHRYGLLKGSGARVATHFRPEVSAAVPVDFVFLNGVHHFYQVLSLDSDVPAVTAARAYVDMADEIRLETKDVYALGRFHAFGEPAQSKGSRSSVEELLVRRNVTLLHYEKDAERIAEWMKKQHEASEPPLSQFARGE